MTTSDYTCNCLSFGDAIQALKANCDLVARRAGWNGKGMFIFIRPAGQVPFEHIAGIVSMPETVRRFLVKQREENLQETIPNEPQPLVFTPYLCMYAADGTIVNGWLASQTDMLAEDWQVFLP